MIQDYFTLAFKNFQRRKLRSFLTLTGILISISTIFVLISLSLGLEKTIQEQFETLGTDKFFIQPRGQFGPPGAATAAVLTKDDVDAIKNIQGVQDVTAWAVGNAKIEFRDTIKFVNVIGVEPEKMDVAFGSYDVESGRSLRKESSREALLGYQYKYNNFLGKPVNSGNNVLINDAEFKVVGIVEQIGHPQDDRQVYVPIDEFRELFAIPERVDIIVVQVSNQEEITSIVERTERELMKFRDVDGDTLDFSILTPEELLSAFGNVLSIVTTFLFGIAVISLLVGGINIANAMFTSVLERTREIGVMKAIGAQNRDILYITIVEAGLLGIVGGILGILLGAGIGKTIEYIAINQLGTNLLKVTFPFYLVLGSFAFAFLVGAVSGLWPAWRAIKIKPIEALRYE